MPSSSAPLTGVGGLDEGAHLRHGRLVRGLVAHDAGRALVVDQADPADEDVVAQLHLVDVGAHRVVDVQLQLVAQPQLFAFELREAPAQRVVLEVRGGIEQLELVPLHVADRQQHQRQHAHHREQPDPPRLGPGLGTGRGHRSPPGRPKGTGALMATKGPRVAPGGRERSELGGLI